MTVRRSGKNTAVDIASALYTRRKALADLMHSRALSAGDITTAVRQITETAVQCLEVERASVWKIVDKGSAIECLDLYERSQSRHSAGVVIRAKDVPEYFKALHEERSISAHDARNDPRTSEFRVGYLEPNKITAMLDAPVFVRGEMVGVVCHEHVGSARHWEFAEELLAGTFADFVALVVETSDWQRIDDALRLERDALEVKVQERTSELRASESSLRALLDSSPVSMVLTRVSDSKVAYANRQASVMFEVPAQGAVGQYAPDFWVVASERERMLRDVADHGRADGLEVQMRTLDSRVFWARVSAQRLRYGGEDMMLAAMVDITDQKRSQERLQELATVDALTGVFNRHHLEEALGIEIERADRYRRPLTIAMLDVDHFKGVNDSLGHAAGDEVLKRIVERCQTTLRTSDVIGRYGGEEFVVVLPETPLNVGRLVAERVRTAVAARPVEIGDKSIPVTVSIGVAAMNGQEESGALLARADAALYAAKQAGRNRVVA